MTTSKTFFLLFFAALIINSCANDESLNFEQQDREVPAFSSDRAYSFIEAQVEFGPRVPNTEAHVETITYFRDYFEDVAGRQNVFVQEFQQEVYGDTLTMYNLLASFGTHYNDRIMLAAHWDSRPRSEQDPDNPDLPVLGADDGGSGVGILMEFASIFAENDVPIGVDIILFDGEDYGREGDLNNYFLGARHWGNNPPVPGYNPRFGILLDMVGGENAQFAKEGYSMEYAPSLVNQLWSIADEFGHGEMFLDELGGRVADDHVAVQQTTGIPMVNIIHHTAEPNGEVNFPPYWHTQNDTMEIIDKETLQAVGDVVLELIYNRIPR
ncbi:MAG: M28 family peptidase [Balneolaceae bacterium]